MWAELHTVATETLGRVCSHGKCWDAGGSGFISGLWFCRHSFGGYILFEFSFLVRFQSAASRLLLPSSRASTTGSWLRSSRRGSSGRWLCPPPGVRKLSLTPPAFVHLYLFSDAVLMKTWKFNYFLIIICSFISLFTVFFVHLIFFVIHLLTCIALWSQKLQQAVGFCGDALCCLWMKVMICWLLPVAQWMYICFYSEWMTFSVFCFSLAELRGEKKTFYWRWRPTTAGLSVSQRSSLQQRAFFPPPQTYRTCEGGITFHSVLTSYLQNKVIRRLGHW